MIIDSSISSSHSMPLSRRWWEQFKRAIQAHWGRFNPPSQSWEEFESNWKRVDQNPSLEKRRAQKFKMMAEELSGILTQKIQQHTQDARSHFHEDPSCSTEERWEVWQSWVDNLQVIWKDPDLSFIEKINQVQQHVIQHWFSELGVKHMDRLEKNIKTMEASTQNDRSEEELEFVIKCAWVRQLKRQLLEHWNPTRIKDLVEVKHWLTAELPRQISGVHRFFLNLNWPDDGWWGQKQEELLKQGDWNDWDVKDTLRLCEILREASVSDRVKYTRPLVEEKEDFPGWHHPLPGLVWIEEGSDRHLWDMPLPERVQWMNQFHKSFWIGAWVNALEGTEIAERGAAMAQALADDKPLKQEHLSMLKHFFDIEAKKIDQLLKNSPAWDASMIMGVLLKKENPDEIEVFQGSYFQFMARWMHEWDSREREWKRGERGGLYDSSNPYHQQWVRHIEGGKEADDPPPRGVASRRGARLKQVQPFSPHAEGCPLEKRLSLA